MGVWPVEVIFDTPQSRIEVFKKVFEFVELVDKVYWKYQWHVVIISHARSFVPPGTMTLILVGNPRIRRPRAFHLNDFDNFIWEVSLPITGLLDSPNLEPLLIELTWIVAHPSGYFEKDVGKVLKKYIGVKRMRIRGSEAIYY